MKFTPDTYAAIRSFREQFANGAPYSVVYQCGSLPVQVHDERGFLVARFDSEADAQSFADTVNLLSGKVAPVHSSGEQCELDENAVCMHCGVHHGDACATCHGSGFHKDGCTESEAVAV